MTVYFGLDSARDARLFIPTFHTAYKVLPSWVGRYLGDFALTPVERDWLHAQGIRILLCWNNVNAAIVAGTDGAAHATQACAAAAALGAPAGTVIALDIETGWSPSSAFLHDFAGGVYLRGYVPVVYGNIYEAALRDPLIAAKNALGKDIGIWASEPEYYAWANVIRTDWTDFTQWLGTHASLVWYHQYGENEQGGIEDFDVATEVGYGKLFAPKAVTHQYTIRPATAGLKQTPSHTSPLAIGPNKMGVLLKVGQQVLPTGKTDHEWTEVRLPNSPVHGWLVTTDITVH